MAEGVRELQIGDRLRARLRDALEIDPRSPSGLVWKSRPANCIKVGAFAGTLDERGYWRIGFEGRVYKVHRIVWAIHTDTDPGDQQIDHIDGDNSNNNVSNLRLASNGQNRCNIKLASRNSSGFKGVTRTSSKDGWLVRVTANHSVHSRRFSDVKHGGTGGSLAAAVEWSMRKRAELHGPFARNR